jgi:NADH:ubiquinone reductase (H+-translocating)
MQRRLVATDLSTEHKQIIAASWIALPCSKGRCAAKAISRQVTSKSPLPPFRYFDKGNLFVVGKNFAMLQSGRVMMSGFFAWLVWALIHIQFPAEKSLRFSVFF